MGSIEGSSWPVENAESSDDADEDGKEKKNNKAPEIRWVPPLLDRPDTLNQRKSFFERPMRPPMPLEKIEFSSETDEDDEDEEDEEESTADASQAEASTVGENAEQVVYDNAPEAGFESGSFEPSNAEPMDIPHANGDRPLTFEEILEREMPPEFAEATSGPELGHPEQQQDIPPIPSWEMPTVEHPLGSDEAVPPSRPSSSSSTGGGSSFWRPSPASVPFETYSSSSASSESVSAPTPTTTSEHSGGGGETSGGGFTAALETLKTFVDLAELANNPNRLITRVLTQVAVEGFLAHRKQERYGNEPLLQQHREEVARLHDEQRRTNEHLVASLHNQQAAQATGEQELFDQNGNRITLKDGQHVEVAAGGYSAVVEHGRAVHDAFVQGEAFKNDQKREQLSDDLFAKLGAGGSSGSQANNDFTSPLSTGQSPQHSGQYTLPSQQDQVDLDHRLPEPRNTVRDAVLSPWLWIAVALLIIVYFIAQIA